jgi:pimeloyl-ACP methyl ester carboxylesterase
MTAEVAMLLPLALACALFAPAAPKVESKFEQVAPAPAGEPARTPGRARAVVLIHGYRLHLRDGSVGRAEFRPWQRSGSALVKELAADADVFSFAYGQNACLSDIVEHGRLVEDVARLRKLGYREIVLLGHSAGGLIARQFVEDNPGCGVTKVVQVCSPNGGCLSATLTVPHSQEAFVRCLTTKGREQCLKERAGVTVPAGVQFVCFVGQGVGNVGGDGVVSCRCQWTADLQKQGIPAVALTVGHREAVRSLKSAHVLAELVRKEQPRWRPERVQKARKEILGK